jgi:hypothetical protein
VVRNPKAETRKKAEIRNPKAQPLCFVAWFRFLEAAPSECLIRISGFKTEEDSQLRFLIGMAQRPGGS